MWFRQRGKLQKKCNLASFGQVLNSNWAGFDSQTWHPWFQIVCYAVAWWLLIGLYSKESMPSSKYGPLTILVIYWTFFHLSRTCHRTTTAKHTGLCPPTIRNTNFSWLESAGVDAGLLHPVGVQPKSESLISKEPCWHPLAWSSIRSVKVKHVYQQVLLTIWNGSAFCSWPLISQVTALDY